MRLLASILWASALTGVALAQEKPDLLDELGKAAGQWARENLDDRALELLKDADQRSARSLFEELNRRLQASNVYDLAPLKDGAVRLLPLLQQSKETRPWAEWLRNRLDYLEVADELRRRASKPSPKPGVPPPPPAPPTPETQRTVWDQQMEKRPPPTGAHIYVPKLKPIFNAQGTPPSLVWLAEVESSFNPQARSPVGAAGLFQFMPATARSLGLSLSPQDERLLPEKSGNAAARYLGYLHRRFADWRLALAAYNAGETRVNTLLVQHKTRSYQIIAPKLPAETQLYVPKIEATLRKREGVTLATMPVAKN